MKIGILSDTHDHIDHTRAVLEVFEKQEVCKIIHCGDFCSPFMIPLFENRDIHVIFGNNDGDLFNIQKKAEQFGVHLEGDFWDTEIRHKKIAVYHGTYQGITDALIASGIYDIVITGHTHTFVFEECKAGKCYHINPGSVNGFGNPGTAVIVDLPEMTYQKITIN